MFDVSPKSASFHTQRIFSKRHNEQNNILAHDIMLMLKAQVHSAFNLLMVVF